MVAIYWPRTTWCFWSEMIPGNTLGEKLLEAWFKSTMTIEKLNTIKEMSPPIKVLSSVFAVSVLLMTSPGATFIKYSDTSSFSRKIMKKAKKMPAKEIRVG